MLGKFKLERIWRWRHRDKRDDTLRLFPESEMLEVVTISEILEANPTDSLPLDDVKWLLLTFKGDFGLFVRDFQDPGDELEVDNELKESYLDLLRYEPPEEANAEETVWRLLHIKSLDEAPTGWRRNAVLAIRQEDKLQLLCEEPYCEANYCQSYCNPPKDSKHWKQCKKRGCI
jgi:hypothetical protein